MAQNVNEDGQDEGDRQGAGGDKLGEDASLRARLAKLTSALEHRQSEAQAGENEIADQPLGNAISLGLRVLTEFVAAILVGAAIGWQLDVWFHTGPILLIVFLGFGTAAGFVNVYRIAAGPTGPKRGKTKD